MVMADAAGVPIAMHIESATPHEVTLVHATLEHSWVARVPERLIGDKAYDSDGLDAALAVGGVEMIAANRSNRLKTQDGRRLRRYKRRWKVERVFAWLKNFRRVGTRYERFGMNYGGMVSLAVVMVVLRNF